MRRIVAIAGAGLVVLIVLPIVLIQLLGSDAGTSADGSKVSNEDAGATSSTKPLDDSPFCRAIRALEALSAEEDTSGGTPEDVLAQTDEVLGLVEDATASAPADAPAEVQALFDDYQMLSAAIVAANGDLDAAFTTLSVDEPELMARLSQPDAHRTALAFFAERCGTAAP